MSAAIAAFLLVPSLLVGAAAALGDSGCPSRLSRVVFSRADDAFGGAWGIAAIDTDGSNERWLFEPETEGEHNYRPAVSPDGHEILWDSDVGGVQRIRAMGCDGSDLHDWTIPGDPVDPSAPAWSPDGSQVAFVAAVGDDSGLFVVPADRSTPARLVTSAVSAETSSRPTWSPDGMRLAFAASRGAMPDIYVVDVDGTHLVRLTRSRSADAEPAWAPDGKRIAFFSNRLSEGVVYVMDASGGNVREVTSYTHESYQPAWSPDGRRLVYVDNSLGHSELWLTRPDGTGARPLTRPGRHKADEAPAW